MPFGALGRPSQNCGVCVARVSATLLIFTDRVVLDGVAFRLVVLGEVDDALCVLGVDRVVPIVCSGVVVEGSLNEEEKVLVVHGM